MERTLIPARARTWTLQRFRNIVCWQVISGCCFCGHIHFKIGTHVFTAWVVSQYFGRFCIFMYIRLFFVVCAFWLSDQKTGTNSCENSEKQEESEGVLALAIVGWQTLCIIVSGSRCFPFDVGRIRSWKAQGWAGPGQEDGPFSAKEWVAANIQHPVENK